MEQPAPVANYAAKPMAVPVTTADSGLAHHDDLEATDHRTMFVVKRASEWMELASKQRTGGGTREQRPTSKKADAQRGEDAEATAQRGNHPKTNPRHAEAGEARGSLSDAGGDHPEATPRHAGRRDGGYLEVISSSSMEASSHIDMAFSRFLVAAAWAE